MLKEWLYNYNSFNSIKVLAWREQLEKLAKGEVVVPITVTVDPTNICNVNCSWCSSSELRRKQVQSIPDKVLLELPEFLSKWGVRSVVISGGGEPLLHPKIVDFLKLLGEKKLKVGLMTNAVNMDTDEIRKAIVENVRWVGISLDAASPETYMKIKRPRVANAFPRILDNIGWLCRNRGEGKRPKVTTKFVIHHLNYGEMYRFAEMSKGLGVDEVHIRPIYTPIYKFTKGVRKTVEFYLRESRKDLEDDNFKVYGIVHKYDRDWYKIVRFQKCYATPLTGVFLANGTFSICQDRREDTAANLGKYYPFEEFLTKWGGQKHKDMIERISPQSCPHCSQCITNEVVESAIINDEMTLEFI